MRSFAALASWLAMLGYLQSSGDVPWRILADRGLVVGAFWVMAVPIYLRRAEQLDAADDPARLPASWCRRDRRKRNPRRRGCAA